MARWLPHLIGLLTPLVAIAGILAGGWLMGATIYLALGIYPILDLIAGRSSDTDPFEEGKAFNYIVHLRSISAIVVAVLLLHLPRLHHSFG